MAAGTILALALLADAAASPPSVTPPAPPANPEKTKLICRRDVETGSLVRATRRCYTREEWAKLAAQGNRDAQTMMDRAGPRSTGGADFTPF